MAVAGVRAARTTTKTRAGRSKERDIYWKEEGRRKRERNREKKKEDEERRKFGHFVPASLSNNERKKDLLALVF